MFEKLAEALMEADVVTRPPTREELEDLDPEELDRLGRLYLGRGTDLVGREE